MELTIVQALQQGVAAHREGKLQEAEHLYRAILQSQPAHPDANHNLGVIAVSVNKAEAALPLFKAAFEANPKIEQYWFSYIETLIKEKRFDIAGQVIEQGKHQGVDSEKLNSLKAQTHPIPPSENTNGANLSQQQITSLLEQYQTGRYDDAEKSARSLCLKHPHDNFSWKILGAVLKQTNRVSEAVLAGQKAVEINPKDTEAYYNLGNTLKELGRLEEAESCYTHAIALQPHFAEAYSNLGDTLKELGRLEEAEAGFRQAIALKPGLAEAHNNLGFALKELNRLDEAEASYKQAIALKPDYAEAHNNFGATLHELGRLKEAEASYMQAIALQPHYAEAYSNLGNTLDELGRLVEAEAGFRQAIALKPGLAEAQNNLGNTLVKLGRLEEAEASYRHGVTLKPDYTEVMLNLAQLLDYLNRTDEAILFLQSVLEIDGDNNGLRAGVLLAIYRFLDGDFSESNKYLLAASSIQEKSSQKFRIQKVYQNYLLRIMSWHEDKPFENYNSKTNKTVYVIGESHSLVSHKLYIENLDNNFFCKSLLIVGCKQFHLGQSNRNQYKNKIEDIFLSIPKSSEVLLAIGEIDCRLDGGIILHKAKRPEKDIKNIIQNTVEDYLSYIAKINSDRSCNVTIQGVPCPNIDTQNHPVKDIALLIEVIRNFNSELKNKSKDIGFKFLDVHKLTDRGDGFSNDIWHLDDYHLSPDGMQEAWRGYASEQPFT